MVEIPGLTSIPGGNVSDDDLLLIYDMQNQTTYKVTRGVLLGNVARTGENVSFADLSAEEATFTQITPALLLFASGGGIADMMLSSGSVSIPTIAAASSGGVNVPVAGAEPGMAVNATVQGADAGLMWSGHVSASGTVRLNFVNATGSSISGASATAIIQVFALPA